eukprot:8274202-Pyramimonas_sp.AAC.1
MKLRGRKGWLYQPKSSVRRSLAHLLLTLLPLPNHCNRGKSSYANVSRVTSRLVVSGWPFAAGIGRDYIGPASA